MSHASTIRVDSVGSRGRAVGSGGQFVVVDGPGRVLAVVGVGAGGVAVPVHCPRPAGGVLAPGVGFASADRGSCGGGLAAGEGWWGCPAFGVLALASGHPER